MDRFLKNNFLMWQLTEHQQKAFTNLLPSIIIKIIKKKQMFYHKNLFMLVLPILLFSYRIECELFFL